MSADFAEVGLSAVKKAIDFANLARADSYVAATRAARVEPIALVDADCTHMEKTSDVMQTALTLVTAYYLQAVALMTNVEGVQVAKELDRLNPNRDLVGNALGFGGDILSTEAFKDRLPKPGLTPALEASVASKENATTLKELANLSVGKIVNVDLGTGQNKFTVPISIRLIATTVPSRTMIHMLAGDQEDKSWTERWYAWKSGRLATIKDMIFCNDLIKAHRRRGMQDKDGLYNAVSKRVSGNAISAFFTAKPSVATASNIVVMSQNTAEQLEASLAGKLSNVHVREKMLEHTTVMLMFIIDPAYERVTIYHRGIPEGNELGLRDLKSVNKSGPDIAEILKAYSMAAAPSL